MDLRIITPREIIAKYDLKLIEHVDGWDYFYSDYDCRDSLRKIRLCINCANHLEWYLNFWFNGDWQYFKVTSIEDIEMIALSERAPDYY